MESSSPEARHGRGRQLLLVALLVVWLAAVIGYSLWSDRPEVTFDHELALGVAALVVASGLASLLLVGRHRLKLATGIVISLVGFGFLLELAQSKYVQVERNETIDIVLIAIGSTIGVAAVWALAEMIGTAWTQRTVAFGMVIGASLTIAVPFGQSSQFQSWWQCDRPGTSSSSKQPTISILADGGEGAVVAGELQSLVLHGARYDQAEAALVFDGTGSASVESADQAFCQLSHASQFTLRIEARSADLSQAGPARLFTISEGVEAQEIALHIGQDGPNLSVRLRTKPDGYNQITVPDMFVDEEWHVFELIYEGNLIQVLRDGTVVTTVAFETDELIGWEFGWPLTLGDEATGDRAFTGSIKEVTISTESATESD